MSTQNERGRNKGGGKERRGKKVEERGKKGEKKEEKGRKRKKGKEINELREPSGTLWK